MASWIDVGSEYDEAPGCCCCDSIDSFVRSRLSSKPSNCSRNPNPNPKHRSSQSSGSSPRQQSTFSYIPRFMVPNYSLGTAFLVPSPAASKEGVGVHLAPGLSVDGNPICPPPDIWTSGLPPHERVLRKAINRLAAQLFPRLLALSGLPIFFPFNFA